MTDRPDRGSTGTADEQTRRAIRDALGTFLTGVTVVTTVDAEGQPRGITANSFTSVSLDPPLVLVCVDRRASSYDAFTGSSGYAVNILGQDHQHVAETFATKRADKFATVDTTTTALGNPVIRGAIAWLDCRTTEIHTIGDHAVLVGQVEDHGVEGGQPLGFHQGRFLSFNPVASAGALAASPGGEARVSWVVEDGQGWVALLERPDGTLALPGGRLPLAELHDDGLEALARRCLGAPVTVDLLYSFYSDQRDGGLLTLTYRGRTAVAPKDRAAADADAAAVVLRSLTDSLWSHVADDVELTVLKRFRVERDSQRFGIYSGTDERGSVATIHDIRPDEPPGAASRSQQHPHQRQEAT